MSEQLRILFVSAEMSPLVSTGGLAEVAGALPAALRARGHDVRAAMPCYRQITDAHRGEQYCLCVADLGGKVVHGALRESRVPGTDIPLYLVEHEGYFGRSSPYGEGAGEYDDNAERFCFFCLALMHGIPQTQWKPDLVHCHDWHTAPIPALLRTRYCVDPYWRNVASLFTIHNLAYQGRYSAEHFASTGFAPELFTPDCMEYEGDMNLMKGALAFADKLTTVSPRYAREIQTIEYGAGLHGMLSARREDLYGVLNGVDYDLWHPERDSSIAANYDKDNLEGKGVCKTALQEMFRLPPRDTPIFGVVSRLHWQKGIDLIAAALDELMEYDLQLVVLGTGDPEIEACLAAAAARYPDKVGVYVGFDAARSHAVVAGSDFLLMPSRYEPCGLGQLYALAYGTVPVVRRTGGLADTVRNLTPAAQNATGISFIPSTHQALVRAIRRALCLYADKEQLAAVRWRGMNEEYSWDRSSEAYDALYRLAIEEG